MERHHWEEIKRMEIKGKEIKGIKKSLYADSITLHHKKACERETGFEPATLTLAR